MSGFAVVLVQGCWCRGAGAVVAVLVLVLVLVRGAGCGVLVLLRWCWCGGAGAPDLRENELGSPRDRRDTGDGHPSMRRAHRFRALSLHFPYISCSRGPDKASKGVETVGALFLLNINTPNDQKKFQNASLLHHSHTRGSK